MLVTLRDRGPDDAALWSEPGIALGAARLSLLDRASSQQPMYSPDGRFVLAYNGEVFNAVELRRRRELDGWRFRTNGDTEVVLALLARMGVPALALFNGQFAGALYDRERRELLLFRDRVGILPLYYTTLRDEALAFGSTLRSLLTVPGVDTALDVFALRQVTTFWAPVAPVTSVRDARQLPPGCAARYRNGVLTFERWHSNEAVEVHAGTFDGQTGDVRAAVAAAVQRRRRADHEVGVLVSGGIDSAIIAASASPRGGPTVRTWSVTFDDPVHDESRFQRDVVDAIGSDHAEVPCTPSALAAVLPAVVEAAETPFVRLAPCSTYLLGRAINAAGVRAVLSGEGADEVFWGYDLFRETALRVAGAGDAASIQQAGLSGTPAERRSASVTALMMSDRGIDPRFASHTIRWRAASQLSAYIRADLFEGVPDPLDTLKRDLPAEFDDWSALQRAQHLEFGTLLPGYLLSTQADRMLMAHSVEARYPFLDDDVVDLALALPDDAKVRLSADGRIVEKRILRAAARGVVPQSVLGRPKQAYRAPVAEILRSRAGTDLVDDVFDPARVHAAGTFRPKRVARLVERLRNSERLSNTDEMALALVLTTHLWQSLVSTATTTQRELIA